jgi:tetratricopeptide (TPR) repeat protein
MRALRAWAFPAVSAVLAVLMVLLTGTAAAAPPTRTEALAALALPDRATRLAALDRLSEVGTMADTERVVGVLHDDDPFVRHAAVAALWQIWGRSGDAAIDRLYARGMAQAEAGDLRAALATFDEIVRRKPAFAEGWNKRATMRFLLGQNEASLRDCDEVLKRNPAHFGALSGAGQIHLQLGHAREALAFFRRAVAVNPDLEGPAQMIPILEEHLNEEDSRRT